MNGRIAIVTGVSRINGIGRAICLELARKGHDIFFTYWTSYDKSMTWGVEDDEPARIAAEVKAIGVRCEHFELDLTSEGAITTLLDRVTQQLGDPSVLINNATYSTSTSISTLDATSFDKHFNLNVRSTTLLTMGFINRFDHGQHGRIINITSGQSLGPMPDEIAYAMSKSAIEMMTTTIASEIGAKGITINAVNPGPNDTGWMDDTMKTEIKKRFPSGRIGKPIDTAKLVGYLVSEEAEWITGQIIHSAGGFKR